MSGYTDGKYIILFLSLSFHILPFLSDPFHLISPGSPRPSMALQVQNRDIKHHHSFHYQHVGIPLIPSPYLPRSIHESFSLPNYVSLYDWLPILPPCTSIGLSHIALMVRLKIHRIHLHLHLHSFGIQVKKIPGE